MFFLNLTSLEFFALLGALGGLITALYLLDRQKRKRVVSTLRFWNPANTVEERRSRRHMQQPWSLLLQLFSLALLLLAIAQLQWGSRPGQARDHILLIDTSAWSGAQGSDGRRVLDEEVSAARIYLQRIPASDRVLLTTVDALSTPMGTFTSDRARLREQLAEMQPGYSALDLDGAFAFANSAARFSAQGTAAHIVYIGPGKTNHNVSLLPAGLRVIAVAVPAENCGIRDINVDGSGIGDYWKATVTLGNDGRQPRRVRLSTSFAGTHFADRTYLLRPASETQAEYRFTTRVAGTLETALSSIAGDDALAADNRAQLSLPLSAPPSMAAFTRRREVLAPLLESGHELAVTYFDPSQYSSAVRADVLFFDQFAPLVTPSRPALYLDPQKGGSPLPVKMTTRETQLSDWSTEGLREIGADNAGLREKELRFRQAQVFETFNGDITIASVAEGPVIVGRNVSAKTPRMVAIGFDLLQPELRGQLTTPLLVANLLHWLSPEVFRPTEYAAERVGALSVPVVEKEGAQTLQVRAANGQTLPFSLQHGSLQIFVDRPQTVRLVSNARERIISLTLPDVAAGTWHADPSLSTGFPANLRPNSSSIDLWKWLAVAGATGLILEWMFFGRARRARLRVTVLPKRAAGERMSA